jgi:NAD(P)-dependent dehydrogenase (short-subunit alcohol dehydrogenase family)
MRAQRSGTIVNVSSIAGFAAGPSSAAYSMSKFSVEGMYDECESIIAPYFLLHSKFI